MSARKQDKSTIKFKSGMSGTDIEGPANNKFVVDQIKQANRRTNIYFVLKCISIAALTIKAILSSQDIFAYIFNWLKIPFSG